MLPIANGGTGVALRRVRLRGAPADLLRARQQLEHALQAVDWSVPGLSARAILLLRRMAVSTQATRQRSPWPQRVTATLREQAAHARRPWLQADAALADAVLFSDETEMLACLVRDWLQGVLSERWWWRGVLAGASPVVWLQQHVLSRGEVLVPVAIQLMQGPAPSARATAPVEAWFARLDDAQAQEALASVARAYALAAPAPLPPPTTPVRHRGADHARSQPVVADGGLSSQEQMALQRLLSTVPELRDSTLCPPQRRLFAQVLAVVRSPSWARTPQLARALSLIERVAAISNPVNRPAPVTKRSASFDADRRAPDPSAPALTPPRARTEPSIGTLSAANAKGLAMDPNSPIQAFAAVFDEITPPATTAAAPTSEAQPVPPRSTHERPAATDIQTQFGGIFYLLNAALALGLYGDFTTPKTPGIALSPWDYLALVGRAWFGAEFVRDPVWALLAALAGPRAKQAPGRDFVAPAAWQIDPSWLAPWGRVDTLHVRATRSRLSVRHGAGFLLFDVARDSTLRPLAQARALCAATAELRGARLSRSCSAGPALPRTGTARWLRWLLGYLEARLALALGVDAVDVVPCLVCRHAARVTASASDVDVELTLDGLPLAIRIAGLDRDPGWIPAAGRRLRFRFT